ASGMVAAPTGEGAPAAAPAPVAATPAQDWAALVDAVDAAGQLRVAQMMRDRVRVIELGSERLVYQQADNFPDDPAPDIREALFKVTGKRWLVERGTGAAQPSLREVAEAEAVAENERIRSDPLVKAAFEAFPEAELIDAPVKAAAGAGSPPWN
ncbi:MAG: DNA polymerase III subunit gamma/tau, partial [Novosphingobium sp.]